MMNMRKMLFAVAAVAATASMALAGGDLTKDQAHIYINAGHGSCGPNARNMATIHPPTPATSSQSRLVGSSSCFSQQGTLPVTFACDLTLSLKGGGQP